MNRLSFDELTASELNDAIDDTNFPKAPSSQCLSIASHSDESTAHHQNGKTNHAAALPPTTTTSTTTATSTNSVNGNDENSIEHATTDPPNPTDATSNVQNGIKGFIKRAHPAPLKMVAFKGDSIDVPGTPRTPRTSTTPGMLRSILVSRTQNTLNSVTYVYLLINSFPQKKKHKKSVPKVCTKHDFI